MTVPSTDISWETVVAVAVPTLAAFGSIMVFFVKRLIRAAEVIYTTKLASIEKDLLQLRGSDTTLTTAHDRLRDRWDEFLREYLKIDSTRGQKVDALFRIVDQMQDSLRDIRPALNTKVEDSFSRAVSELKVYVRDQIREERKNV